MLRLQLINGKGRIPVGELSDRLTALCAYRTLIHVRYGSCQTNINALESLGPELIERLAIPPERVNSVSNSYREEVVKLDGELARSAG